MQAVWTVGVFGGAIILLALVAGVSLVWIALFAALWLVVLIPLTRAVRAGKARW